MNIASPESHYHEKLEQLVKRAVAGGSRDDITVLLVRVSGRGAAARSGAEA